MARRPWTGAVALSLGLAVVVGCVPTSQLAPTPVTTPSSGPSARPSAPAQPSRSPSPSPRETPAATPALERLEGAWLLRIDDSVNGAKALGRQLLLDITPGCVAGACSATLEVFDPDGGARIGDGDARFATGKGYAIDATSSPLGTCPVSGSARRPFELELAFVKTPLEGTASTRQALTGTLTIRGAASRTGCLPDGVYPVSGLTTVVAMIRPTPRPDPAFALVALPKLTVKIRFVTSIRYYGIGGRNPGEIAQSIRDNGPPGDHPAFSGHQDIMATTTPDYTKLGVAQTFSGGTCKVTAVTGKATYKVTLPRLTSPSKLPKVLLAWWKVWVEHTRWHEEQHILISQRWIGTLKKRVVGQACSKATSIIAKWTRDMYAAQLAFDRKDSGWQPPAYTGPWNW